MAVLAFLAIVSPGVFAQAPAQTASPAECEARSLSGQLNQSEQMETVEIWEKVAQGVIEAKAWIYDPTVYVEPWYVTRQYTQVANADKSLRMNYWHCGENANNEVFRTPDGSTQYKDFQFTDKDNR